MLPRHRSSHRSVLTASIASLLAVCGSASAQQTWDGSDSADWNLPANWSGNALPGGNATINIVGSPTGPAPFTATISSNIAATPVDIFVGTGAGNTGRLDHTAGTAGTGDANWMFVGVSGGTGTYNLANTAATGGTLTGFGLGSGSMNVGAANTGAGRLYIGGRDTAGSAGTGTVNINTTGTLKVGHDLFIGNNGGTGVLNLDAGTINRTAGWLAVGNGAGSNGTLNMSGGTVNGTGETTVGRNSGTGVVNVSGGNFNVNAWLVVAGGNGNGTINVSGTGTLNQGITDAGSRLELTNGGSTGTGTVNLNGGTIFTHGFNDNQPGTGSSFVNLNGGTLRARSANATFMQSLTRVNVRDGGAVIDTNGLNITIAQPLLHSDIGGDAATDGGLIKNGAGTLTLTGISTFTGAASVNTGTLALGAGGGAGAIRSTLNITAGATVNTTVTDALGFNVGESVPTVNVNGGTFNNSVAGNNGYRTSFNLTGGTVSSSGGGQINFTDGTSVSSLASSTTSVFSAPILIRDTNTLNFATAVGTTASGIDLSVTGVIAGPGGLGISKSGDGKLSLGATNTYTGATTINAGTLQFSGTGSSNTSSGITLNGSGAKLVQVSSTAVTPVVTLTNGSVDGTGTIDTVNVADLATNTIANGNGAAGTPLTIGTLTFAGAGRTNLLVNSTSAALVTTTLAANGAAGSVTIDASNLVWNNGATYDLISYGGGLIGGTGFGAFQKGTIAGLSGRQNAALGDSGTAITLAITGDLPVWTGVNGSAWVEFTPNAPVSGTPNFALKAGQTATDFWTADVVEFNDTYNLGAGNLPVTQTTVNIQGGAVNAGGVAVTNVAFNNSAVNYTVTGTGVGITSGSLTKNGTAVLNLGGAHTYTGPTLLNAGTTNLSGTLGNTAVTVAAGTTLNATGAGAISQNTVTVNGTYTQTVDNALSGTAAIVFNNGGTLNNANSHNGGSTLAAGTVNVGNGAAFGSGPLIFAGGMIDNPVGPVTIANAVRLGTDASVQTVSLNPTNALTFSGPVTAGTGGTAGGKTLNLSGANTSFTGNITPGTATGLVINNSIAGTLTLSGPASTVTTLNLDGGAASILDIGAGNLTLSNGGGSILQSLTGGTINGTGSLISGGAGGDLGTAGGTTLTINANLGGTNVFDLWNNNGGAGMGTIVLTAANTGTGGISIQNTKVVLPAGAVINANNVANSSPVLVGNAGVTAELEINGGTINANRNANPSFGVGVSTNGSNGIVTMTDGTINASGEVWLADVETGTATATMTMSAGQVNSNGWFVVGRRNGTATLNLSGGTITKGGTNASHFIFGSLGGSGTLNQTGGIINVTAGDLRLGENNGGTPSLNNLWDMDAGSATIAGTLHIGWRSSQATVDVSNIATLSAARLAVGSETSNNTINNGPIVNGAPVGTLNISGGTVSIGNGGDSRIGGDNSNVSVNAEGIVNVSGGSLGFTGNTQIGAFGKGTMNISGTGAVTSSTFTAVGRFAGSVGTLNVNGGSYTQTGQFLMIAEEGTGTLNVNGGLVDVTNLRVGHGGTGNGTVNLNGGTLATEFVQKTVAGSTAAFKFNGGVLKSKASSADFLLGFPETSITVENGGAKFDTGVHSVTITQGLDPAAGSTGGLTKLGTGTLTLTGTSDYTGATEVSAGTLLVNGSLAGTSAVNVANGAILGGNGSLAATSDLTLASGATLAPGTSAGLLNTGDVTFSLGSTFALEINGLGLGTGYDSVNVTGGVSLNGAALTLTLGPGFAPAIGQNFAVLTNDLADIIGGTFGSVNGGAFGPGNTFAVTNDQGTFNFAVFYAGEGESTTGGNDVVLSVVPEPGSAVTLLAGVGVLCGLRRRRRVS